MTQPEQENEERRAVETLAHDPAGLAWAKRTRIVREPWLLRARQQLRAGKNMSFSHLGPKPSLLGSGH